MQILLSCRTCERSGSGSGKWSGAGSKNQMSGSGAGAERSGAERERSGERAESAAHNPLKLIDIVSYHTPAFCSQFPNFEFEHVLLWRLCKFVEYFPST